MCAYRIQQINASLHTLHQYGPIVLRTIDVISPFLLLLLLLFRLAVYANHDVVLFQKRQHQNRCSSKLKDWLSIRVLHYVYTTPAMSSELRNGPVIRLCRSVAQL